MAGFDLGFGLGNQQLQHQQQVAQEQRIAMRDAQAKLYEQALNNPDVNEASRRQLLSNYTSLFAPHEHASILDRLSGLIHGQAKGTAKAEGQVAQALTGPSSPPPMPVSAAAPATSPGTSPASGSPATMAPASSSTPAPTPDTTPANVSGVSNPPPDSTIVATPSDGTPSSSDLPASALNLATGVPGMTAPTQADTAAAAEPPLAPFQNASHPYLDRLHAGINAIDNHLKGFAQPVAQDPNAPADAGALLAATYKGPEALQERRIGIQNQAAINLQKAKTNSLLAGIQLRDRIGTPEKDAISAFMAAHGIDDPNDVPFDVRTELHRQYGRKDFTSLAGNPDGTFSKNMIDPQTGEVVASTAALPPRGFIPTSTTRSTTDPTGLTTTSRSATTPHIPISPNAMATPASLGALASAVNSKRTSAATNAPAPMSAKAPKNVDGTTVPLTPDGMIPQTYKGAPPVVVTAANRIMAGADPKDIHPPKVSALAQVLAEKGGWDPQGTFTPSQNRQLNTATHFVVQAAKSPNLFAPLDDYNSRKKLQVLVGAPPPNVGLLKSIKYDVAADNLTPAEDQYLQTYNQLVGTISGLAPLVRAGKMTEAGMERFINELPNPYTTANSQGAIDRMNRIIEEIKTARKPYAQVQQDLKATDTMPTPTSASSPDNKPNPHPGMVLRNGPRGVGWYKQ